MNTKDHLPNVIATQLAALFEGARDYSLAGKYFLIAAESARSVFAYSESLRLAWHGLVLIRKLRDSPERAAMELSCLLMMGRALLSSKSYAAGEIEFVYSETGFMPKGRTDAADLPRCVRVIHVLLLPFWNPRRVPHLSSPFRVKTPMRVFILSSGD